MEAVGVTVWEMDRVALLGNVAIEHGIEDRTAYGQHVLVRGNADLAAVFLGRPHNEGDVTHERVAEHESVSLPYGWFRGLPVGVLIV